MNVMQRSGQPKIYMRDSVRLALISLIIFGCNSTETSDKTDWKKMNLFGRVKSFQTTSYEALDKFGEITKGNKKMRNLIDTYAYVRTSYIDEIRDKEMIFSENGYLIEVSLYDMYNNTKYSTDDEYQNDIEYTRRKLDSRYIYTYNVSGELTKLSIYTSGGELSETFSFEYDNNKNIIRGSIVNSDGQITRSVEYDYDTLYRKRKAKYSKASSKEIKLITYAYSDSILRSDDFSESKIFVDERLDRKVSMTYDNHGNKISYKKYRINKIDNSAELAVTLTYEYDTRDNLVKKVSSSEITTYKYNGNNNLIESDVFTYRNRGLAWGVVPPFRWTSIYRLDSYGNWVVQTVYKNGIPKFIIEREINYFE